MFGTGRDFRVAVSITVSCFLPRTLEKPNGST
jgi:hypothetical protein